MSSSSPHIMHRALLDQTLQERVARPIDVPVPQQTSPAQAAVPSGYKPQLDGLRFFAFASVFLHHAIPQNPQNLPAHLRGLYQFVIPLRDAFGFGLCIFFCLSSYLITDLLISEKKKTGKINLPWFYVRRILRIWPLYFAILAICTLLFRNDAQMAVSTGRLLAMLFLVGNWYSGKYGFGNNPIGPLWSISLEEQFYLIWPWIVRSASTKVVKVLSLVLMGLSPLAVWILRTHGSDLESGIWTNSFVQFGFFATGTYLALVLRGKRLARRTGPTAILGGLAAFLIAASVCSVKNDSAHPNALVVCLGYVLLMLGSAAILTGSLALPASIFPKPLLYLGKISYGLYVFHALCLYAASLLFAKGPAALLEARAAAFLATIALASLSYFFFEQPFLHLKDRFASVKTRQI